MKEESQFAELALLVPCDTEDGGTELRKVHAGTTKLGIIMGDLSQVSSFVEALSILAHI